VQLAACRFLPLTGAKDLSKIPFAPEDPPAIRDESDFAHRRHKAISDPLAVRQNVGNYFSSIRVINDFWVGMQIAPDNF